MSKRGENIYKGREAGWEGRCRRGRETFPKVRQKEQISLTVEKVSAEWLLKERLITKASTYAKYVHTLNRHILPYLGAENISEITSYKLNLFIEKKLSNGRLDCKGGLAPKTVHDIYIILKSILRFAESEYEVSCRISNVSRTKYRNMKISVLDISDQKKLEEFLLYNKENPSCLGILICLYTGMRLGEICALKWEHIHLKSGVIRIASTLQRIQNVEPEDGPKTQVICSLPKSETSSREIPIPDFLREILKDTKPIFDLNCYFLTGTSWYLEPRTYQNHFKKYLKFSQIPNTNFHSLRHTFATRCIAAGVDIKTLSEILGHSNVQMTLNYYVHTSIEDKRRQLNLLRTSLG